MPPPLDGPGRAGLAGRRGALRHRVVALAAIVLCCAAGPRTGLAQELSKYERERARMMLNVIKKDVTKYYYDETFHGLDLDATFEASNSGIDRAQSLAQLLAAVSIPLFELKDSHTFFIPPEQSARFRFGWTMQAIGDRVYITAVQEGGAGDAKGLKRGDRVMTLNDGEISRENLWALLYAHRTLVTGARLPMLIQSPGEDPRRIEIAPQIEERKTVVRWNSPFDLADHRREMEEEAHLVRHRYQDVGENLLIWKMPRFNLTDAEIR